MVNRKKITLILFFILMMSVTFISSCKKDKNTTGETVPTPTPYSVPDIPNFRAMPVDPANPLTVEGIALGKKLFSDPILSKDSSLSCDGCHKKENSFSDPRRFSMGVDGDFGNERAPPQVERPCRIGVAVQRVREVAGVSVDAQ